MEKGEGFIFIDSRGSGEEELYEILRDKYKLPVKHQHVDSSDIQFGEVGIERKTVADLQNSVIGDNRHFFDQMKVLKDTYKYPILIVEGMYSRKDRIINGILYSLLLGWKIPFVNTFNLQDTAEVVNGLLRRYGKSNCRDYVPAAVKKAYKPQDIRWMMLCCIPGIGPKKAKAILKGLPYLFSIKYSYTKKDLQETLNNTKGLTTRSKNFILSIFSTGN